MACSLLCSLIRTQDLNLAAGLAYGRQAVVVSQNLNPSHHLSQVCMATFEFEMEKAFAFQASQDKVCSICMEVILEKASASERRFGILSSCNHTYCLSCIRQWRCAKQFENQIIK